MNTQLNIEQFFESITQFSSQMFANRKYIKSIKEIMGTTFKLSIKLTEEEQGIFSLFNLLNKMYNDLRDNESDFIDHIKKLDNESFNDILNVENDPNKIFKEIIKYFSKKDGDEKEGIFFGINDDKEGVSLFIENEGIRSNIKVYQDEQRKRLEQSRLLNETSLITISNIFESLIFNLISFLVIDDKQTKIQEKTLTFKQIEEFGSLDEAKDYLIEKIVEDTMRGSQLSWLKYIGKNTHKAFFSELTGKDEDDFVEFFLKRNLITHNNSKINKKYLNSCKGQYSHKQTNRLLGRRIVVKEEYLLGNLSLIYIMGIKASYYVAKKKFAKKVTDIFKFYESIAFENLQSEENEVAYAIYNMLWKEKDNFNASEKMLLCINYMQSLKWTKRTSELDEILKKEDFTLVGHEHKMCLNILKGDYEGAIKEFQVVLSDENDSQKDEISSINDYKAWPIFKEFHLSDEFKDFIISRGYKSLELKIVDEVVD